MAAAKSSVKVVTLVHSVNGTRVSVAEDKADIYKGIGFKPVPVAKSKK